jgi:hypothetical protein
MFEKEIEKSQIDTMKIERRIAGIVQRGDDNFLFNQIGSYKLGLGYRWEGAAKTKKKKSKHKRNLFYKIKKLFME